jgi:hypothetical protein
LVLTIDEKTVKADSFQLNERKFVQLEFREGESWETDLDLKDAVVKLVFVGTKDFLKSLNLSSIKKSYEDVGVHKVLMDTKVLESDRDFIFKIQETESEEDVIRRYGREKKIDIKLLQRGLDIFGSL